MRQKIDSTVTGAMRRKLCGLGFTETPGAQGWSILTSGAYWRKSVILRQESEQVGPLLRDLSTSPGNVRIV